MKAIEAKVPRRNAAEHTIQRVVEKASEVFLEFGYDHVSMDLVAERADVSRRTIYNYFSSKEALFERIIRETSGDIGEILERIGRARLNAEEQLLLFCSEIAKDQSETRRINAMRLNVDISRRFPVLAAEVRKELTEKFEAGFTSCLDMLVARGELEIEDTRSAAYILAAVISMPHHRILAGVADHFEQEMQTMIEQTVRMFVEYYRPAKGRKSHSAT